MGEKLQPIKLSAMKKNRENPFMTQTLENIEKHIVKKFRNSTGSRDGQRALVAAADIDTGEIFRTSFVRQVEVDDDKFVKLYLTNLSAFFDLSKCAIRVFSYIMNCLKPRQDLVVFDMEDAKAFTEYRSNKSVYSGLTELVQAEIIARGPADNLYFINPLIIFNGDRVSFTKEFVKKKKDAAAIESANEEYKTLKELTK